MPKNFRAAALAIALPFAAQAAPTQDPMTLTGHDHTVKECMEASEFILHAAQARDNKQSGTKFMQRLEDDLTLVRKFPPHLRWFVYSKTHEEFLRAWVKEVFATQRSPQELQRDALVRCQGGRAPNPVDSLNPF